MAEPKNKATEDRVDLFIDRGNGDDPNFLIAINGVNYILPKGKTSRVPKYVAEEYWRSREAQNTADETIDRLIALAQG